MSDDGFKKYIENKTAEDIMNEYGEQKDEWETLLCVKDGEVVRFRHSNGKDFFCEQCDAEYADCNVDDEMLKILSGKTIEQQMEYFYVTESRRFYNTEYGEITKENLHKYAYKLCDYEGVRALLVKNGILVGAKIDAMWNKTGKLFRKKPVCTYYASDNEGSGTKERKDNAYLIFFNINSQDCPLKEK